MSGSEVLAIVATVMPTVAIAVVGVFKLYVQERVRTIAGEATAKALADYRHEHEKSLAALTAEYQRRLGEHSVLLEKRHGIYAAIFRYVRAANDQFTSILGFFHGTDFSRFEVEDVGPYLKERKIPRREGRDVIVEFERGRVDEARKELEKLEYRYRKWLGRKAYDKARNLEAIYELYLSDAVRLALHDFRQAAAKVIVAVDRDDDERRPPDTVERLEKMDDALQRVLVVMRSELANVAVPAVSTVTTAVTKATDAG